MNIRPITILGVDFVDPYLVYRSPKCNTWGCIIYISLDARSAPGTGIEARCRFISLSVWKIFDPPRYPKESVHLQWNAFGSRRARIKRVNRKPS